MKEEETKKIEK